MLECLAIYETTLKFGDLVVRGLLNSPQGIELYTERSRRQRSRVRRRANNATSQVVALRSAREIERSGERDKHTPCTAPRSGGPVHKSGLESRIICVTNCGGLVFEVQWTQRSLANLAMPLWEKNHNGRWARPSSPIARAGKKIECNVPAQCLSPGEVALSGYCEYCNLAWTET